MFASSYREARDLFRSDVRKRGGDLRELVVDAAEDLTIDVAVFNPGAERFLVVSSGLHGVEGFAGSAVQLAFLKQTWPDDIGVVLLHALNPYGMHFRRRVNESNVDLNRNFLAPGESYAGSTEGYKKLNPLLNKPEAPGPFELFLPRALWAILTDGFNALKQAVVGGQYDYPEGLFFGGHALELTPTLLQRCLPDILGQAQCILHVDFHTGLGKQGDYALLVDAPGDSEWVRRLRAHFGPTVQPWDPDEGIAYQIRGGFPGALKRWFGDRIEVLTCEFGTHPPLTVLKALALENRVHHWGGDTVKAKAQMMEAFCPKSSRWRAQVLAGGQQVLNQSIRKLTDFGG